MNIELYAVAQETKLLYRSGKITRAEAMEKIKPYADFYNTTAKRLAIKYNQKPKLFNFSSFMR